MSKRELEKKEKYIHELAKIAYDAKHGQRWALSFEDGKLIDGKSSTKEILGIIGVFTPAEFIDLTKGYDMEIKSLPYRNPYDTTKEEDGIYIEKCDPLSSMSSGRHYALIKGNKKAGIYLNTKTGKSFGANIVDRQEDGFYMYSTSSDEIRFLSNEEMQEKCAHWRTLVGREESAKVSDEEIIACLTNTQALWSLCESGKLIANQLHNGQQPDEARVNQLFTLGIKAYVEMYDPRIVGAYETELEEVADWTR